MVGHHIHNYTERDRDVSKATMTLFSNYVKHGYLFAIMSIDKHMQIERKILCRVYKTILNIIDMCNHWI